MQTFQSSDPHAEVLGASIYTIIDAAGTFKRRAEQLLERNGITHLKLEQWYPLQPILNVLKDLYESVGPQTIRQIGRKVLDNAVFPSDINSLEQALASLNVAYHLNHHGNVGDYKFEKISERSAKMICNQPYPCEMDHGIIISLCNRFRPANVTSVNIKHDASQPCRKRGDEVCIYLIS